MVWSIRVFDNLGGRYEEKVWKDKLRNKKQQGNSGSFFILIQIWFKFKFWKYSLRLFGCLVWGSLFLLY